MEETIIQGNPEINEKQENVVLGILGALIGGLLGGASIVLLDQAGVVAAISGVILAFCTLKGYELLGKKLSTMGIVICIVVMLVTPYLASRVTWALAIMDQSVALFGGQIQFGDAFKYVHDVVEELELQADYWKNLLFVYAFAALGGFTTVKQAFKQKKAN